MSPGNISRRTSISDVFDASTRRIVDYACIHYMANICVAIRCLEATCGRKRMHITFLCVTRRGLLTFTIYTMLLLLAPSVFVTKHTT
jgi:hypothetical protein